MTREEAIAYGEDYLKDLIGACCHIEEKHKDFVRMAIKALEQEPKTGHWVKKSQYGNDYCSKCDYELLMRGKPKYCPNCGSKMVESKQG